MDIYKRVFLIALVGWVTVQGSAGADLVVDGISVVFRTDSLAVDSTEILDEDELEEGLDELFTHFEETVTVSSATPGNGTAAATVDGFEDGQFSSTSIQVELTALHNAEAASCGQCQQVSGNAVASARTTFMLLVTVTDAPATLLSLE